MAASSHIARAKRQIQRPTYPSIMENKSGAVVLFHQTGRGIVVHTDTPTVNMVFKFGNNSNNSTEDRAVKFGQAVSSVDMSTFAPFKGKLTLIGE